LWADDPEGRLRELLEKRRPAYAQVPYHIDTTYRSVDQVVEEVLNLVAGNPTHWQVSTPTGSYPVQLVPGGVAHLGALLRAHGIAGDPVMVSDENVWALHGDTLQAGLRVSGYTPHAIVLPAGEGFKTLDTVRTLYDHFVAAGLDRGSAVVAMGGGVITDMAGFASATFMRGVPLVPVPATLLGMIDASVGGKVAVDHPAGKNLVGAFVQPLLVLLDPNLLATLPDLERRAGLAEVIKAGIIADRELFAALEAGADSPRADDLRWQVERALQVKIDVVEKDPYEHGRRMVLNLGHTFAHAFEVLSDYGLNHGLAVSMGMAAAAHLAEIRGMCRPETVARIVATLEAHRLPTRYDAAPPSDVYRAMGSDKKRRGGRLRFILPRDIGDVVIDADVRSTEVLQALERIRTSGTIQPGAGHLKCPAP
jgi:shikimate kinase / 3-dehydroquinate synthase